MNFITPDKMPAMPGGHLFNDPEFHALKQGRAFYYGMKEEGRVMARAAFYLDDNIAISGWRAPFGSIDFTGSPTSEEIRYFLKKIIGDLKKRGVYQIRLNLPPGYSHFLTPVEKVLLSLGFTSALVEVNQHMIVDDVPFSDKITQKERNKLNRAKAEGYEFAMLGQKNIRAAFNLITSTHGRKNYPVTLDEEEFSIIIEQIPCRYLLFGLYDKGLLIAVVASVRVEEDVLYNFYHADHNTYRQRSPLVMLLGEVYNYCQKHKIGILDLGISSVKGQLNEGLFRFKQNLGGQTSDKQTLVMHLKP